MTYPPGYFSDPVRAWHGLREYEPQLHLLLRPNGNIATERSARSTRTRDLMAERNKGWGARTADKRQSSAVDPTDARFYAGPPCKRGHSGMRYRAGHTCVECSREASRARRGGA